MIDRLDRQIKDALCARGAGPTWHSHLPWVLIGLHVVPKEDSAVSLSRADQWVTTHPPWPATAHAGSSTCWRAAAGHEAGVLCGRSQHAADTPVRANWRPAEAPGGPICWHLPGGLQGGQDVYHPGGPEAGDSLCGPPEGPHRGRYLLQGPPLAADLPRSRPLPQSILHLSSDI